MTVIHHLQTIHANARETKMLQDGIDRFHDRQADLARAGSAAERDDYASMIRRSLLDVAEKIEDLAKTRSSGPKASIVRLLKDIREVRDNSSVTLSYLSLSTVFSFLVKDNDKSKLAAKVGTVVED